MNVALESLHKRFLDILIQCCVSKSAQNHEILFLDAKYLFLAKQIAFIFRTSLPLELSSSLSFFPFLLTFKGAVGAPTPEAPEEDVLQKRERKKGQGR